jgi:hypothetical protein
MTPGRTITFFVMIGALLGTTVASLVVPPILAWYNEPGSITPDKVQTVCNLAEVIRYATGRLIRGQLIGALIGGGVFFVIGLIVSRRRTEPVAA